MTKTILFIHGAWLTPAVWDRFRARYEALGYTCLAPAWPFQDRSVSALCDNPHPNLRNLTIDDIVDHYAWIIQMVRHPPILIGHGFGGLVVQQLLDRGLGAGGVAIAPIAPRGIWPTFTAVRTALPVLLPWGSWTGILGMSFRHFARSFVQEASLAEQYAAYDSFVVPAPGRLHVQAAFGAGTEVRFDNDDRAPLLLIAGEYDRISTPTMVEATYRRHAKSHAQTDLKVFPGRAHLLIAMPGWEQVADYVINWARETEGEPVAELRPMQLA